MSTLLVQRSLPATAEAARKLLAEMEVRPELFDDLDFPAKLGGLCFVLDRVKTLDEAEKYALEQAIRVALIGYGWLPTVWIGQMLDVQGRPLWGLPAYFEAQDHGWQRTMWRLCWLHHLAEGGAP